MFQPTENKVVVKVANKHIKSVTNIQRISALQNNTTIDPADFVSIVGEVVALPKVIRGVGYEGFTTNDIYEGDTAIFSYQVIYDLTYKAATDTVEYKNMAVYKGKEYFLAGITKIFGVIRGGDIYMINGYVMLTEYPQSKIILQQSSKKGRGTTHSTVMHIGKERETAKAIDVASGDEVLFSPYKAQHYHINGKPFIILRQNQILGRI